jgi:hypothetical protein
LPSRWPTRKDADVTALDVSADALAVARRNAASNGARVTFLQSDWYAALQAPRRSTSSPPTRPTSPAATAMSEGDLRYEPVGALTDHADGLSALRIIIAGAPAPQAARLAADGARLRPGRGRARAARSRLHEVQSWRDLAGIERVTGGRLKPDLEPPAQGRQQHGAGAGLYITSIKSCGRDGGSSACSSTGGASSRGQISHTLSSAHRISDGSRSPGSYCTSNSALSRISLR